ncbi:MAG TPA: hypothetical protein VHN58_04540 [Croceicoccus sp.]|nr:hypothetical protein [Croceicoccus sp.]
MNTLSKAIVGTTAAGAMALASASPAFARDRYDHDRIDAGDVIAGALIIGGIAAIASAASKDRDGRYYDDRYDDRYGDRYGDRYDRDYRYNNGGGARRAVEQCVAAAERDVRRYGFRDGDVTDIRKVDRRNGGYRISGRIAVDTGWRGGRYGRGWDRDYRGWNSRMNGWDSGKFTCDVRYGQVRDVDFSGIRGMR